MKHKLLFLIVIAFLLASNGIQAQNFSLGIRGGISIPNLTAGGGQKNPLNTGYKSRLGPDMAVFSEFGFSKSNFSLITMLEYSSQGGKKTGMQAFPVSDEMQQMFPPGQAPQYLYANYRSTAKMNYLLLPVLAKFEWKLNPEKPISFYAGAGPFVGYLLNAKQVTDGSSYIYTTPDGQQPIMPEKQSFDASNDIRDQLHKWNAGVSGNIGFAWNFTRNRIFIEGGGNYGFVNIQKGTENGKNHTGAGTVDIGFSHQL